MFYSILHHVSHLLPHIQFPITLYMAIMVTYITLLHKQLELDDVTMTFKLLTHFPSIIHNLSQFLPIFVVQLQTNLSILHVNAQNV